jgi:hypothetical protein
MVEQRLKAGEYEPGRKGGKGYWSSERYLSFGGWRSRQVWVWVDAPPGYVVKNGNLQIAQRAFDATGGGTMVSHIVEGEEKREGQAG